MPITFIDDEPVKGTTNNGSSQEIDWDSLYDEEVNGKKPVEPILAPVLQPYNPDVAQYLQPNTTFVAKAIADREENNNAPYMLRPPLQDLPVTKPNVAQQSAPQAIDTINNGASAVFTGKELGIEERPTSPENWALNTLKQTNTQVSPTGIEQTQVEAPFAQVTKEIAGRGQQYDYPIIEPAEPEYIENTSSLKSYLENKLKDFKTEQIFSQPHGGMAGIPMSTTIFTGEKAQEGENYKAALGFTNKADKLIQAERDNKSFVHNVAKGAGEALSDPNTWFQNYEELADNINLLTAVNKLESGEQMTDADQKLLDAASNYMLTEASVNLPRGYKAGKMVGQQIPFFLQLYAGGKISEVALKPIQQKLFRYIAAKVGTKMVGRASAIAVKTAEIAAGAGITSLAVQPLAIAGNAVERVIGKVGPSATYQGRTDEMNAFNALSHAVTSQSIENFTEMTGLIIAPGLAKVGGAMINSAVGKRFASSTISDAIKTMKASELNKTISQMGWQGLPSEWFEEQEATILHSIFDGDSKIGDLLDGNQQLDILIGLSLTSGVMASAQTPTVIGAMNRRTAQKRYEKADLGVQTIVTPEDYIKLNSNDIPTMLSATDNYTDPKQQVIIADFIAQRAKMQGVVGMIGKQVTEASDQARTESLENSNKDTGQDETAILDGDEEHPVKILRGDHTAEADPIDDIKVPTVVIKKADGTIETVESFRVRDVVSTDAQAVADLKAEEAKNATLNQAADEMAYSPENQLNPGDSFTFRDQQITVAAKDELENQIWLMDQDGNQKPYPLDMIRDEIQKELDLKEEISSDQNNPVPTENVTDSNINEQISNNIEEGPEAELPNSNIDGASRIPDAQSVDQPNPVVESSQTTEQNQPISPIDQIPFTETKGEKTYNFEQAQPELTAEAFKTIYEGDENDAVTAMVSELSKERGKLIDKNGKVKDITNPNKYLANKAKVKELDGRMAYWQSVQTLLTPNTQSNEQNIQGQQGATAEIQTPADQTQVTAETEKEITPVEILQQERDRQLQTIHNGLVNDVKAYNLIPKPYTNKRRDALTSIRNKAQGLDYTLDETGGMLSVTTDGKHKIHTIATQTDRSEIENHNAFSDYEPRTQGFMTLSLPDALHLDTGMSTKETEQAIKNIQEGKKTVQANKLLDFLDNAFANNSVAFRDNAQQPGTRMSVPEYMESLMNPVEESSIESEIDLYEPIPTEPLTDVDNLELNYLLSDELNNTFDQNEQTNEVPDLTKAADGRVDEESNNGTAVGTDLAGVEADSNGQPSDQGASMGTDNQAKIKELPSNDAVSASGIDTGKESAANESIPDRDGQAVDIAPQNKEERTAASLAETDIDAQIKDKQAEIKSLEAQREAEKKKIADEYIKSNQMDVFEAAQAISDLDTKKDFSDKNVQKIFDDIDAEITGAKSDLSRLEELKPKMIKDAILAARTTQDMFNGEGIIEKPVLPVKEVEPVDEGLFAEAAKIANSSPKKSTPSPENSEKLPQNTLEAPVNKDELKNGEQKSKLEEDKDLKFREKQNAIQDITDTQIQVNGQWYAKKIFKELSETPRIGDIVAELNTPTNTDVNKQLIKDAEKLFGTTDNYSEAGYLTTDGKLLDFSGRHEDDDKTNTGYNGERFTDHRAIQDVDGTDIVDFMSYGNIRMKSESDGFELTRMPTTEQIKQLKKYIRSMSQGALVDFSKPGSYGIEFNVEYSKNANVDRIINDISRYYNEGIKPVDSGMRFRSVSPIGLYSTVENALDAIQQEKGTPEQFKAMLLKNGAKQAEMEWMGFDDAFTGKSITKADVQKWIDENRIEVQEVQKGGSQWSGDDLMDNGEIVANVIQNEDGTWSFISEFSEGEEYFESKERAKLAAEQATVGDVFGDTSTKYSQYTVPGGTDYRELLLTMPELEYIPTSEELEKMAIDNYGKPYSELNDAQKENTKSYILEERRGGKSAFKSAHFDEPNILAHVRFDTREINGEKILFLQEIQSDFAQQGKKHGFKKPLKMNPDGYKELPEGYTTRLRNGTDVVLIRGDEPIASFGSRDEAAEWIEALLNKEAVPDMPFKKTDQWVNLAVRRIIRYASENGFQRIAWTNGNMQAERYDLSKQVNKIVVQKQEDGQYRVAAWKDNPTAIHDEIMPSDKIADVVGKEIADKAINQGQTDFKGDDLKIGGSGMRAFYDQIVPAAVSKLGKPFGAKVEVIDLDTKEKNEVVITDTEGVKKYSKSGYSFFDYAERPITKQKAYELIEQNEGIYAYKKEDLPVQSLPLTPEMRHTAMAGLPLFKESTSKANSTPDISTEATQLAEQLNTPITIVTDLETLPKGSRQRNASGWYDTKTGGVTLVLPNIKDATDAQRTILHEIVAHKGLRGLLGDNFTPTMEAIFDSMPKTDQESYYKKYGNKSEAGEEYAASQAETMSDPTTWQKIVAFVRDAFRKMGINLKINDKDIAYLLWKSKNRMKEGDSVFEVAEKISKDKRFRDKQSQNMIDNRDAKIKDLSQQVSDIRKEMRTNIKDVKHNAEVIMNFARAHVNDEVFDNMQLFDYKKILTEITNAVKTQELDLPFARLINIIDGIELRRVQGVLDNLLSLKIEDKDKRGVSVAKNVDEHARDLMSRLKEEMGQMKYVPKSEALDTLRAEQKLLQDAIKADPFNAELRQQLDDVKEKMVATRISNQRSKAGRFASTADQVISRINALNEKGEQEGFTDEDYDELAVLEISQKLADIMSIDADIITNELESQKTEKIKRGEEGYAGKKKHLVVLENQRHSMQRDKYYAISSAVDALGGVVEQGRKNLIDWQAKKIEQRKRMVNMVAGAIKGKRIPQLNEKEKKSALNAVNAWFKAPLMSIDFVLRHMDRNHNVGEGPLYKYFMRSDNGLTAAYGNYTKGRDEFFSGAEVGAKRITGKNLTSLIAESSKVVKESVHLFDDEGNSIAKDFSKGQAMYVYMVWQMDDGRAHLLNQNITEESISEIESFIGQDYIALAEWLQDEYLPSIRESKYNPTHIEMFGTSMAFREHYFPIKIDKSRLTEKSDLGEEYVGMPSTITGNIINRTNNLLPIDTNQNAFQVLERYGKAMEEWNAFAKVTEDLNSIIKSMYVRNQMNANEKGLFDFFKSAALVSIMKFESNLDRREDWQKLLSRGTRLVSMSKISGRQSTAIKQVLSLPAVFDYSVHPKFIALLIRNITGLTIDENGHMANIFSWANKNLPTYHERVTNGYFGNEVLRYEQGHSEFGKFLDKVGDYGMLGNRGVDAYASAVCAKTVYDYSMIKNDYMPEGERENFARYEAGAIINETQQSNDPAYLSAFQANGNVLNRMLSTFQNNNFAYQRKLVNGFDQFGKNPVHIAQVLAKEYEEQGREDPNSDARRDTFYAYATAAKRIALFGFVMSELWQLGGVGILGFWGDDEDAKRAFWVALFTGWAQGIPIFGDIAESLAGTIYDGMNGKGTKFDVSPFLIFEELNTQIGAIAKAGKDYGVSKQLAKKLVALSFTFGGVNAETIENIFIGAEMIIRKGGTLDDKQLGFLFLINLPASQRKIMAGKIYADLPINEFAEKLAIANKAMKATQAELMLTDKPRTQKLFNDITDLYYRTKNPTYSSSEGFYELVKSTVNRYENDIKNFVNDADGLAKYKDDNKKEAGLASNGDLLNYMKRIDALSGKIREAEKHNREVTELRSRRNELTIKANEIYEKYEKD